MYWIGIDLGGTNLAAGLVDATMRIVDTVTVPTGVPRPLEEMLADMKTMVDTLLHRHRLSREDIRSVGVGVPCTANVENGHIEDANNLGFDDLPFAVPLSRKLGLPVFIGNDANAAAWGEYLVGDYPDSFLMITLGTGIGGGIILNGRLWQGINGAAGEFGHMVIAMNGEACTCGRQGCWEAYASASALVRQARRRMGVDKDTALWKLCGGNPERVEAKTVFDGARAGDTACLTLLDAYTTYLSEGVANLINLFQPAVICIGGGVSRAGDMLLRPLREKTAKRLYSQNARKNTVIVPARLGNDAGILGAALLGENKRSLDREDRI